MDFDYKKKVNAIDRRKQCEQILQQYPGKIPIICEKDPTCKIVPIEKTKFLINENFTVQQFINLIRTKLKLLDKEALFIFFGDKKPTIASSDRLIGDVYQSFKDPSDGYLYAIYSSQEIWGD